PLSPHQTHVITRADHYDAPTTTEINTLSLHDALPILEERAVEIGEYIVQYHSTVRQTAKQFGVSKSTVHKDVTQRLLQINPVLRSEEHTSELQSRFDLVCRLLLEKKKINKAWHAKSDI